MQNLQITIVYHSGFGHTKQVATVLAEAMQSHSALVEIRLLTVDEAIKSPELLHNSDTIVFGSPTYFGNVSAEFKKFMETTGGFWFSQKWKDKLAAGFTNSSTTGGDKLATLSSLSLFAAQHSMIWISQGVMPRFLCDQQTDGQNRLGSYLGLMVQSDNNLQEVNPMQSGDLLTTELFAKRIVDITLQYGKVLGT
ncbi:flavodoxin family protein [Flavobacterium wongokense]|uniref:flavodoxin family protein n=1 Tax=Flavobacterium wongokense TaxID=2910674 RepID=UPI0021051D38|nr:flavodoxin family protein [Flavobacterium sp. WG47]